MGRWLFQERGGSCLARMATCCPKWHSGFGFCPQPTRAHEVEPSFVALDKDSDYETLGIQQPPTIFPMSFVDLSLGGVQQTSWGSLFPRFWKPNGRPVCQASQVTLLIGSVIWIVWRCWPSVYLFRNLPLLPLSISNRSKICTEFWGGLVPKRKGVFAHTLYYRLNQERRVSGGFCKIWKLLVSLDIQTPPDKVGPQKHT